MNRLFELRSNGYAEIGDDIWYPNRFFNAMVKIKKSTGQISMLKKFPHYEVQKERLYSTVCKAEGELVFVPLFSDELVSFELCTETFISVKLEKRYIGEEKPYFKSAFAYGDFVYLFPLKAKCIVRYDLKTHRAVYLKNDLSVYMEKISCKEFCFGLELELIEGKIYIPFVDRNAVAVFDLAEEHLEIRNLDIEGGSIAIQSVGEDVFLAASRKPVIYRWNRKTGKIQAYTDFSKCFPTGQLTFSGSCLIGNKIFFFPLNGNCICSFDLESERVCEEQKLDCQEDEYWKTYFVKKGEENAYVLTADKREICKAGVKNGLLELTPYFSLDHAYNCRMISNFLLEHSYYYSRFEEKDDLREYMEVLMRGEGTEFLTEKNSCGGNICGEQILNQIMETSVHSGCGLRGEQR